MLLPSNPAYLTFNRQKLDSASIAEKEYHKASSVLSSGGNGEGFSDVSDVEVFVGQQVLKEKASKYEEGNKFNIGRLAKTSTQLELLGKVATELQVALSNRSNPGVTPQDLATMAKTKLDFVENILNTKFGNESLLSGDATITRAVGSLDNPAATTGGTVTKDYYLGNFNTVSFAADANTQIDIEANAGSDGIASLVYALNVVIHNATDPNALNYANDMSIDASTNIFRDKTLLDTQFQRLTETQTGLAADKENIEAVIQRLGYRSTSHALQDLYDKSTSKDIMQALAAKNNNLRELVNSL